MKIDIDWFFSALLWTAFVVMWGWMIYIVGGGDTGVGLAGLMGMCAISVIGGIFNFICCFGKDDDDD